jgi:hypothetical protein
MIESLKQSRFGLSPLLIIHLIFALCHARRAGVVGLEAFAARQRASKQEDRDY